MMNMARKSISQLQQVVARYYVSYGNTDGTVSRGDLIADISDVYDSIAGILQNIVSTQEGDDPF